MYMYTYTYIRTYDMIKMELGLSGKGHFINYLFIVKSREMIPPHKRVVPI